jgi:hypothetical protein
VSPGPFILQNTSGQLQRINQPVRVNAAIPNVYKQVAEWHVNLSSAVFCPGTNVCLCVYSKVLKHKLEGHMSSS